MKPLGLQLKRLLKTSPLTLAFVLFPFVGLALDVKDVPNPRQINGTWVTDMAGLLDEPTEAQLNSVISQLERKNGAEIAVVTVSETAPAASPKQFTTALFKYWGIGKKGKDNGVLFLISKGDRRVEIETGYGVEAILPSAKVSNIIDSQITPRFKKGDFKGGTLAGTKALVVALDVPQPAAKSNKPAPIASSTPITVETQPLTLSQEPTQDANVSWGVIVGGGVILAIGTVAFRRRRFFIEPEGYSRLSGSDRVCFCAKCKKRMEKVDDSTIQSTLSNPEKVAQQLGSLRFAGWKCPNCSQQLTALGFHKIAHKSHSGRFCECPTCQELTATCIQKIAQHSTKYSSGRRLIIDECHCCSYHKQREETIPRLPPPPPPSPPSSHSSSGGYSGGSYSSSDSGGSYSSSDSGGSYSSSDSGGSYSSSDSGGSYSSSDSGGGSFGGGDSGGSGAGGSW